MQILVDSSVWIDYFRGGNNSDGLDYLIDENFVAINQLILTELVPFLKIKNQSRIITLLYSINTMHLDIKWQQIIDYQYKCLKKGINGIGIPDLIIAQNALQNGCEIYSLDKHFSLLENIIGVKVY